jgi:hypothetical protein
LLKIIENGYILKITIKKNRYLVHNVNVYKINILEGHRKYKCPFSSLYFFPIIKIGAAAPGQSYFSAKKEAETFLLIDLLKPKQANLLKKAGWISFPNLGGELRLAKLIQPKLY